MERVRNAFLILLRAGLWESDPTAEEFMRLSDEEWEHLFRLSARQTVTGIVFDGICRLPDEIQPSERIFARWLAAVDGIERSNERMNVALKGLAGMFVGGGLNPVLQKGQGIAVLYPAPSHRECGDIDLFFPQDQFLKAAKQIRASGAGASLMPDGSLSYDWQGIDVEHHPEIVDLSSPCLSRWLAELTENPGEIPSALADGLSVPSPELNALMLNAHILKHAIGKGVGLRQMCDLAMVYHSIGKEDNPMEMRERIFTFYRRAGILKWSRLLHSFLVGVIGLPKEELPYPEKLVSSKPLERIVEEGGNFGQYRTGGRGNTGKGTKESARRNKSVHAPAGGRIGSKLATAGMIVRRAGFSLRFAPAEVFWNVVKLLKGQFGSLWYSATCQGGKK